MEVVQPQSTHWPVSYHAAFQQSKDKRGTLHLGTNAVQHWKLDAFCTALRENLDKIPEFQESFFCHELRGLKGATAHEEDDDRATPEAAFDTFFDCIDMERIDEGDWKIDVGLEIYDAGNVVVWSKAAHSSILRYLLPSMTIAQVEKLQARKGVFNLDNLAHLDDFAGFRCETGKSGDRDRVEYINVYTTDKCVTYQLHSGIWRRRSCEDLLPQNLEKLLHDLANMSVTYKACSGAGGDSQDGSARLEVRVPLRDARIALRNVPHEALQGWTFSIPVNVWW